MNKSIGGRLRTLALFGLAILATNAFATISVTLTPSPASPQPVGTVITWTASVQDSVPGTHEYQFSVGPAGGPLAIVHDFKLAHTLAWAFSQTEGTYQVKVVVQNTSNQTSAQDTRSFAVTSLRLGGLDAVNPTANPLVALFSGPPCDIHNTVRVRFNLLGSSVSQATNAIPCNPTKTANFYIAGMYPSSVYQMHHETVSPSGTIVQIGRTLTFTTGPLPTNLEFPTATVPVPAQPPSSVTAPILLHSYLPTTKGLSIVQSATDLSGNVLWYYHHPVGETTRTEVGGKMFVLVSHQTNLYNNIMQEIDLAGNITASNQRAPAE